MTDIAENPADVDYAELAHRLAEALRLTQEYVTNDGLPPIEGWSWFDALRLYQDAENLNGRTYVFQPAGESPEHPTIWSDRPDIFWCTRCDCFHRTDFDHDWNPADAVGQGPGATRQSAEPREDAGHG